MYFFLTYPSLNLINTFPEFQPTFVFIIDTRSIYLKLGSKTFLIFYYVQSLGKQCPYANPSSLFGIIEFEDFGIQLTFLFYYCLLMMLSFEKKNHACLVKLIGRQIFLSIDIIISLYLINYQRIDKMVRIIENYTLYQVIGEGAYGKVYRAINKLDNKEYAVKVIEVKKFQTNKKLQECTVHEINILTNIEKNNHIITYYDMLKTQNNFYFVYEYCNGGTLEGMLRKQNQLDQKSALLIFKQLLEAFQVLNKYNIMHRDLKPDNIFFHNGVVKVGDFGFCKSLQKAEMTKTMLGSPIYMAPEILNGQIYSNKADIWSIGVVLYEMLYGYCPFQSNSIPKLIQVLKETDLQFPNDVQVSNQTKKLLKRILTKDPQKRIEWMQLFQIKISNDGKLLDQLGGKFTLVEEEKNILKTVKQISEANDEPTSPTSPNSLQSVNRPSNNFSSNYNNFISPRNASGISSQSYSSKSTQPPTDFKIGTMKKQQGAVDEGETVAISSPLKKIKSMENGPSNNDFKQKISKFHSELVRGINIARSMGINGQKYTPLFTYHILKAVSQRIKGFKNDELSINANQPDFKQYRQILDSESDDIDYQMAMMRNKIEDFPDWRKAIKSKVQEIRNTRLCYEMIMFLSNEVHLDNVSQNQMRYIIRSKLG